uniref:Uncharacterized protein n=1 Tax=Arundo donax TaxID=35708 RepID=A0A0A9A2M2_ARUDO
MGLVPGEEVDGCSTGVD